jgi:hypothetical protein
VKPKWLKPNPRRLSANFCKHCGSLVLHGLDDDVMGLPVDVDPIALTELAEKALRALGRTTYELDSGKLYFRYPWMTQRKELPIYAQHICGDPIPKGWARAERPRIRRSEITDHPPF